MVYFFLLFVCLETQQLMKAFITVSLLKSYKHGNKQRVCFFRQKGQEIAKVHPLLPGHVNDQKVCSASADLEQVAPRRGLEAPPASGCSHFFSLAASADRSRGKQSAAARYAYTWPSSWAMVNAVLSPLSSMMLQLLYGSHTVPNSARPSPKKGKENPSISDT